MVWVLFDALFRLDIEILLLAVAFIIILAGLSFFLGRSNMFKSSPMMKNIIAFALSLICIYGLSTTRISLENIFYRIGFTGDLLYNTILAILIAFFWISGYTKVRPNPKRKWKKRVWRLYRPLIILGTIITLAGFTPLVYEKAGTITVGLVILGLGLLLYILKKRKKKDKIKYKRKKRKEEHQEKQEEHQEKQEEHQEKQEEHQKRVQRQQRLRSAAELNRKYQSYSNAIQHIQRRNKGKVPALGTHDGNLRHRYIQAMKAIENLARNQGIRLKSVRRIKYQKQERMATTQAKKEDQAKRTEINNLLKQRDHLAKEYEKTKAIDGGALVKIEMRKVDKKLNQLGYR